MGAKIKWILADYLSWLACKLRGHRWYAHDNFAGANGNRPAELKQRIWELVAVSSADMPLEDHEKEDISVALNELGQLAGEQWGHRPDCLLDGREHNEVPK